MSSRSLGLASAILLSAALASQAEDRPTGPNASRSVWLAGNFLVLGPTVVAYSPPARSTAAEAPRKLPPQLKTNPSAELGALQRKYRKLLALGLVEEALEVAKELGEPPAVVHAVFIEAAEVSKKRSRVVQASSDGSMTFESAPGADWGSLDDRRIDCDFQGASSTQVAAWFHRETGLAIHVDAEACSAAKRIHLLVRGRPAKEAMSLAFAAAGLATEFRNGRLSVTVRPPAK